MDSKHSEPSALPVEPKRPAANTTRTAHHETPTVNSWEAFVAHRRALYAAQLEALKRK
jgi:hypothetical protein